MWKVARIPLRLCSPLSVYPLSLSISILCIPNYYTSSILSRGVTRKQGRTVPATYPLNYVKNGLLSILTDILKSDQERTYEFFNPTFYLLYR
jgi:hypothetical protein